MMIRPSSLSLLAALLLNPALQAGQLNDTGQTDCYTDTDIIDSVPASDPASAAADAGTRPRQDCRYGRDAAAAVGALSKIGSGEAGFDFTALDADGNETTFSSGATPHSCVRDNTTGLTWEVKTDDGGMRDKDNIYTSQDDPTIADSAANYVAAVNAVGLCGHSDWRQPNLEELRSIVHYGRTNPAIDTTAFPNTMSSRYWSASSYYELTFINWVIGFNSGLDGADMRIWTSYVRLVRGGG